MIINRIGKQKKYFCNIKYVYFLDFGVFFAIPWKLLDRRALGCNKSVWEGQPSGWLFAYSQIQPVTMQPQVLHCFIFRQQQARTAGNECFIVRPAKSHVCVGTYGMYFFYFTWDVQMSQMCEGLQPQQLSLTFQLADLRLTVRPLLVTVHFILMKKSRSVLSSLPFLPKPLPGTHTVAGGNITLQCNEHVRHMLPAKSDGARKNIIAQCSSQIFFPVFIIPWW